MKEYHDFEPIPGVDGKGYCALQIYKPGTFFGRNDQFGVMVGGCGVGGKKTLREAKAFLLERAIVYCQRIIDESQHKIDYYGKQIERLRAEGLREVK